MKKDYYTYIDNRLFYNGFTRSQKLRFNKILTKDDIIQTYKEAGALCIQLDYNEKIKKIVFEEKPKNFTFKYENDTIIILYKGLEVWGADLEREEIEELENDCFLCDVILEGLEVSTLDKDNYFYKKIDNNKRIEKTLEKIVNSKTLFKELKIKLKNYLLDLKKGLKEGAQVQQK